MVVEEKNFRLTDGCWYKSKEMPWFNLIDGSQIDFQNAEIR
jgi:hypothetical protein